MDTFQKSICLTKWNGIGDVKALERFGIKIQSEINIKDSTNKKLEKLFDSRRNGKHYEFSKNKKGTFINN